MSTLYGNNMEWKEIKNEFTNIYRRYWVWVNADKLLKSNNVGSSIGSVFNRRLLESLEPLFIR